MAQKKLVAGEKLWVGVGHIVQISEDIVLADKASRVASTCKGTDEECIELHTKAQRAWLLAGHTATDEISTNWCNLIAKVEDYEIATHSKRV